MSVEAGRARYRSEHGDLTARETEIAAMKNLGRDGFARGHARWLATKGSPEERESARRRLEVLDQRQAAAEQAERDAQREAARDAAHRQLLAIDDPAD